MTDEVIGTWRKLRYKGLYNLCSLHHIITVTKSTRLSWADHVARVGEMGNVYEVLVRKPEGNSPFARLGVDGRAILKEIL